ncbi:hypothetical protein B0A48_05197 [Cryoendolithus antarcticus]|uniref:Uncharacterized protein n=1 Tax=Cryoendolithus antarcticus TaxID=1507870 RepID=A0A1V8TI90_9PEZI|nr:hypothetical protein B0A48_05197 [Cryoendolithus antarcticus]
MCKITTLTYTCKHALHITHSACGRAMKQGKLDSKGNLIPQTRANLSVKKYNTACHPSPYLDTFVPEKCGPCQLAAEDAKHKADGVDEWDEKRVALGKKFPKMNWAAPGEFVVKPLKKGGARRRNSLLSVEVMAEDVRETDNTDFLVFDDGGFKSDGEIVMGGNDGWDDGTAAFQYDGMETDFTNDEIDEEGNGESDESAFTSDGSSDDYSDYDSDDDSVESDVTDEDIIAAMFGTTALTTKTTDDFDVSAVLEKSCAADGAEICMSELGKVFDFDFAFVLDEENTDGGEASYEGAVILV